MKNGIPDDEEFNDYFAPDYELTTREKIGVAFFVLMLLVIGCGIALVIFVICSSVIQAMQ